MSRKKALSWLLATRAVIRVAANVCCSDEADIRQPTVVGGHGHGDRPVANPGLEPSERLMDFAEAAGRQIHTIGRSGRSGVRLVAAAMKCLPVVSEKIPSNGSFLIHNPAVVDPG